MNLTAYDSLHSELLLKAPIPLLILDLDLQVALANDAFLALSAFDRDEVLGKRPPFPWWDPDSNEIESFSKGPVQGLEKKYIKKDGSPFWVKLTVSPITAGSAVSHYMVSMTEITDRSGLEARDDALERAYAALQQELAEKSQWGDELEKEVRRRTSDLEKSKEFWEQLFQHSPEALMFLNGSDEVIKVNRSFCDMFGYTPEETVGKQANSLVAWAPGVDIDAEAITKKVYSGEAISCETKRSKKDGTIFPVFLHGALFKVQGETFAYCGYRDITVRKKIEDRIKCKSDLQNLMARVSFRFVRPCSDIESPIAESLADFGSFLGASFCSLIQVDGGGSVTRTVKWHKIPPDPKLDELMKSLTAQDIPWLWSRLSQKDVVIVDGLDSIPPHRTIERTMFASTKAERFAIYPLMVRGALSGAITVGHKGDDSKIGENMSSFCIFSSIVAGAIERHDSRQVLAVNRDAIHKTFVDSIMAMADMVSTKDPYTAQHQRNVSALSDMIAAKMSMDPDTREGLRIAALVHDLGKIKIPSEILNKPGVLSDLEFDLIREHPVTGAEILSNIQFPWPVYDIVLQHHERMNGSGYPKGLTGDHILLQARIISVADTVDAMTSDRPYRPGLGLGAAVAEIKRGKGSIYDPNVVDACLDLLSDKKDLSFLDAEALEDVTGEAVESL